MSERIQVTGPVIAPVYSQAVPSQTIDLGQVAVQLDQGDGPYKAIANVAMKFVPDHRLGFVLPLDAGSQRLALKLFVDPAPDTKLTLTDRGVSFDVFCAGAGGEHGGVVLRPRKSGVVVTPPSNAISTATFHLFNFPEVIGRDNYICTTGEPPEQAWKTCGRVVLKADGWTITVAATDQTESLTKALKAQGGYAITHMGLIEREDQSTFCSGQLDDLLSCLHYFLSFALGCWAGVALPVGFDADRKKVYEQWGMRMTADGPWNGSCSWFEPCHGDLLSEVFPGFMALWRNGLWRESLTSALYWYLGACDRGVGIGVDTGLILSQTALELLAWTHCVKDRKMVSAAAFKPGKLSAADKLRLLASALGIPQEIPSSLPALLNEGVGKKWVDAMDAITGIRNSVVHPNTQSEFPGDVCYEAWTLSLWYIDMVLLRLCNHNGEYANRLTQRWVGQVELVPWAQKVVP